MKRDHLGLCVNIKSSREQLNTDHKLSYVSIWVHRFNFRKIPIKEVHVAATNYVPYYN